MTSRRLLFWSLGPIGVLLVLVAVAIPAESLARGRIDAAAARFAGTIPGVKAVSAGGPALWQVATGSVELALSVNDDALQDLVSCRIDRELTVSSTAGGVVVEVEQQFRGVTVPASVLLVPQEENGQWILAADSVSINGLSIPAQQAAALLGDRGAEVGSLLEGVALPLGSAAEVTDIAADDGELRVSLRVAIAETSSAQAPALESCIDEGEAP